MNTLRIAATLLVTLAAAACSVSPTAPALATDQPVASMEGTGAFGGGTKSAP